MTDFSAAGPMLGYLHQVRFSLLAILDREEVKLRIESLDDLTFYDDTDDPIELLQLKHSVKPASLTNSSVELWKSIRIWSERLKNGEIETTNTVLSLITTAEASNDSAAFFLRVGSERNPELALNMLLEAVAKSTNAKLESSYSAFKSLSNSQRASLISIIQIVDASPDILRSQELITKKLAFAVSRERRLALVERVEGWWFDKCIKQLRGESIEIVGYEVFDKIAAIAEQLKPDALPIDYFNATPLENLENLFRKSQFVDQLQAIAVNPGRIEKAILDFYRAFEQRSRWAREDLLIGDEVENYEKRLIDEWERFKLALEDDTDQNSEIELQRTGRQILRWAEQVADIRIRPNVTEPYVMRGSYHMLVSTCNNNR